jgi:glycyl-tRNA synthetase
VLAERGDNPALAAASAQQLQQELSSGAASALPGVLTALARPTRIVKGKGGAVDASVKVDPAKFEQKEERDLHEAYLAASSKLQPGSMSIGEFLEVVQPLVAPIDAFFDKVFVMCEDEGVKRNRLALLRDVAGVTRGVVDLSQLPGF